MMWARPKTAIQRILKRYGYRIIRCDNMPQADLGSFCRQIAQRGFKPTHVLDVGANKGEWSREVRATFTDAIFTLIEPQAEMRPFLDKFCSEVPGARWLNAGAGAWIGEHKLTIFPDNTATSFAFSDDVAAALGLERRMVPLLTLDHVCAEIIHAIPEMVKLDVEGFEYEVLKGSSTLLGKTEIFLIELPFFDSHPHTKSFPEMVSIMADFGYRPYDFTWFMKRPYDGALGLCELVFAREFGRLREYRLWE